MISELRVNRALLQHIKFQNLIEVQHKTRFFIGIIRSPIDHFFLLFVILCLLPPPDSCVPVYSVIMCAVNWVTIVSMPLWLGYKYSSVPATGRLHSIV